MYARTSVAFHFHSNLDNFKKKVILVLRALRSTSRAPASLVLIYFKEFEISCTCIGVAAARPVGRGSPKTPPKVRPMGGGF